MVSIARVYGPIVATKLDKIKNLHSTDTMDTENSGTRGRPIWVHSSQVGKADSKWVYHVVAAYPNVSPGPMNGSILLRWANFYGRYHRAVQRYLLDFFPGIKLSSGMGTVYLRRASPGTTMISLTKDWMNALRSVNSLSLRKSFMSLA